MTKTFPPDLQQFVRQVRARLESIDRSEGIHRDGDEALGTFFDRITDERS